MHRSGRAKRAGDPPATVTPQLEQIPLDLDQAR
jgi:hypothetical protein